MFADSGGSVKSADALARSNTSLAPMCKKPTANLCLISGRLAKALASLLNICTVLPEPSLNV